jgi:hypothetical protein
VDRKRADILVQTCCRTIRYPRAVFLWILASVLFRIACANAQTESGTVVILGYSKQKVVIAADSRESNDQGLYRDGACKIAVLGGKFIFIAAGRTKSIRHEIINGIQHETILWDSTREAEAALVNTERVSSEQPGDFQDRVAAKWGLLFGTNIASNIQFEEARHLFDNQILVEGLLIGIDELRRIHISHETIRAKIAVGLPQIAEDPVKVVNLPDAITFTAISEADIFNEFQAARSSRSKKWQRTIPSYAQRLGIRDRDAAKAVLLVDLTGTYGAEMVPSNPTIRLVGGKTDAIKLTPTGGIHWVQRKLECPEH